MSVTAPTPLFDADRMRIYPCIGLILNIVCLAAIAMVSHNLLSPWRAPVGGDFLIVYSAGKLALQGDVSGIAESAKMLAVHRSIVPGMPWTAPWPYPPMFLLLLAPLALLPYVPAYLLYSCGTLAFFLWALSRLYGARPFVLPVLASPAVLICLSCGQNAFLTAGLFAAGFALIATRPFLAGVILGALVYKPQFGLFLPLAFLVAGQVRAFCGAGVGALGLSALATAVFGLAPWRTSFEVMPRMMEFVANGDLATSKIISVFNFAHLLGASVPMAMSLQVFLAACAAFAIVIVWRRQGPSPLAGAVLISGTMLALPYVFDYEFPVLLVPLTMIAADMSARGVSMKEKVLIVVLYLSPLSTTALALETNVQIGVFVMAATLALSVHRALVVSNIRPEDALA